MCAEGYSLAQRQTRGHCLTCHGIKLENEHLQPGNFVTSAAFEDKYDRMKKSGVGSSGYSDQRKFKNDKIATLL